MDEKDKSLIISKASNTNFKFGDGNQVTSEKEVTITAVIGGYKVKIITDNDIPLLLGKSSLKNARAILNFNDSVTIMGQNVKLSQSSSGHYCLPLFDF